MKRYLILLGGAVSVFLGVLGIILPLLPTTPFLLLAAFLFSRSSKKFHKWLLGNKVLGRYLYNYSERKGITMRDKVISLSTLWIGITISFIKVDIIYARVFLIIVLLSVTSHLIRIKTLKDTKKL